MQKTLENIFSTSSETFKAYRLLSPSILLLIIVFAFPIFFLITYSFWTQDYVTIDTTLTLENYKTVINKSSYHVLIKRSLTISSLTTIVTVLLAYPMAYFVAFVVKDRKLLWLIILTIPFWTSYLLRVFAWKLILGYNGVINGSLSNLRFFRITLPLSFPGVLAASLIIFIPTTGDYITPKLVGGSEGIMVANLIQIMFGKANNWPLGSSIAVITMIIVTISVILFVLISRWLISKIK